MNTSYFAKNGSHPNGVCICLYVPKGLQKLRHYPKLAPTKALLKKWKDKEITEEVYENLYWNETLQHLDPQSVFDELGEDAVLLCYEKSADFCHRHIVTRWFYHFLKVKLTEL